MFQTELNHWLQSIDYPWFSKFMEIISMMGTVYFLTLIAFLYIAGIHFRKGFLTLNIFMWAVLLTFLLKASIDYPRPLAVDPSLKNFGYSKGKDLSEISPNAFFELFSPELLEEIRKEKAGREGLPSGHTSLITVIFLGFAVLIRKKWFTIISIILIFLTMLSRLYLAQHFLGDVIGGLTLGILSIAVFYWIIQKFEFEIQNKWDRNTLLFFMAPLIPFLLVSYFPAFQTGSFLGLNLGYLVILKLFGKAQLNPSAISKSLNVIIFFVVNFSGVFFLNRVGLPKQSIISAALFAITIFITFIVTTYIGKKLKFIHFDPLP